MSTKVSMKRKHSSSFKLKLALLSLREDKTLKELSIQYGVCESVIRKWRNKIRTEGEYIFNNNIQSQKDKETTTISQLHEEIGKLTMEINFLKKVLDA